MRTKKSIINSSVNVLSLLMAFIPNLIVRKVFLESLGSQMLGLTSLYTNIIGWLSIVELGVGGTIVYSLYKPFANKEYSKINAYIRFYGTFYRIVGIIIFILGLMIVPFIKFFINENVNLNIARVGLILFLTNTFISYMFSNKICLLNVAQQSYKITIGTTISKLLISIFQYSMLKIYPSFILYILIQIFINIIYYVSMNQYINKRYPWINGRNFELDKNEKKNLIKNVKAMFMHKIGTLIVFSTDNIIISKFVGLTYLTRYTNYQIVINALQNIVNSGLNGITASIGNLIAEDDKQKSYDIHKKVFFINFWIVSFITISLYNTLNQFIVLWVGKENLISNLTFNIILINLYFSAMRGSVEQFQSGSGCFYQDRYAPICESVINLVSSLILVKYIGLPGVFIGTLMSNFLVVFWSKPYIIYKYVFDRKVNEYFIMYFKYVLINFITLLLTNALTVTIKYNYNINSFILNCFVNIVVINTLYLIIFRKTDELKYYKGMIKRVLNKYKIT